MRPTISVITVVRNDLERLRRTVDSVAAQTFDAREHLIIDGASTDGTVPWLEGLNYPELRWVSEPDEGIYDAMNKAAELADGDLLIFLNAGDTYRHDGVLAEIAKSHRNHGWDWSYARALVVDEEGQPSRPDYGLRTYTPFRHAYTRVAICHQTVAMRRAFFYQLGGFRLDLGHVADFALLLRAGLHSRPWIRHSVDVNYLDGGVSYTNPYSQIEKHHARVDEFRYGPIRSALDRGFCVFQEVLAFSRRTAKRAARRVGAQALIERWAGRRL